MYIIHIIKGEENGFGAKKTKNRIGDIKFIGAVSEATFALSTHEHTHASTQQIYDYYMLFLRCSIVIETHDMANNGHLSQMKNHGKCCPHHKIFTTIDYCPPVQFHHTCLCLKKRKEKQPKNTHKLVEANIAAAATEGAAQAANEAVAEAPRRY